VRHVQPFSATTASLSSKRTPSIRSTRPADSVISPSNSFGAEARSPNMIRRETALDVLHLRRAGRASPLRFQNAAVYTASPNS